MNREQMVLKSLLLFGLSLVLVADQTFAENPPNDLTSKVILQLFQRHNKVVLCLDQDSSLPVIHAAVDAEVKRLPAGSAASQDTIAKIVYTQYPCPFSPYRKGIRPAERKDLIGVWLFPETSQKLRFGPRAPMWKQPVGTPPIKCEGVAYYENGEARTAQFGGTNPCPFTAAKVLNDMHERAPKVETWTIINTGRMRLDRSDVPNHVEEWDVFVVEAPLQAGGSIIKAGDLIAYRRRESGNEFNVATTFRHLQKLP